MTKTLNQSMTKYIISISWNASMKEAAERMQRHQVRHLPVKDDQGEIVGMLSDRDVQRSMISEVRSQEGSVFKSEEVRYNPDAQVRDYMGWPVLSVEAKTRLKTVTEKIIHSKVSALLVTREGAPVGIITTDDLLTVLAELLGEENNEAHWSLEGLLTRSNASLFGMGEAQA